MAGFYEDKTIAEAIKKINEKKMGSSHDSKKICMGQG